MSSLSGDLNFPNEGAPFRIILKYLQPIFRVQVEDKGVEDVGPGDGRYSPIGEPERAEVWQRR